MLPLVVTVLSRKPSSDLDIVISILDKILFPMTGSFYREASLIFRMSSFCSKLLFGRNIEFLANLHRLDLEHRTGDTMDF